MLCVSWLPGWAKKASTGLLLAPIGALKVGLLLLIATLWATYETQVTQAIVLGMLIVRIWATFYQWLAP